MELSSQWLANLSGKAIKSMKQTSGTYFVDSMKGCISVTSADNSKCVSPEVVYG